MNAYLVFILAIIIVSYLLELIVEFLNVKNISPELPDEFKGIYDNERYKKCTTGIYNLEFLLLIVYRIFNVN